MGSNFACYRADTSLKMSAWEPNYQCTPEYMCAHQDS
jgi:hypothetical protein